jgi:hypothetical protein
MSMVRARALAGVVAGIVGLVAASTEGATIYKAQLICDVDGSIATPFTDVVGSVQIKDDGEVKVKVKGLQPNAIYACRLICDEGIVQAECPANSKGAVNAKLPGLGRSDVLADGCSAPRLTMFSDDAPDDFCKTGYGFDTLPSAPTITAP